MAKVITQDHIDAAVAKAVAKNTKEVLKAVGEVVKTHIGAQADVECKISKKAALTALKAVGADVKSVAA
jgi:hypothetical protein